MTNIKKFALLISLASILVQVIVSLRIIAKLELGETGIDIIMIVMPIMLVSYYIMKIIFKYLNNDQH